MKTLFLVLALFLATLLPTTVPAQVNIGVHVGAPVCQWGYFSDYPYSCAPYGYYDSSWFYNGVFVGAGPWFAYRPEFGHPSSWYRGYYGSHGGGHGWDAHTRTEYHGGGHMGGGFHSGGGHGGHR